MGKRKKEPELIIEQLTEETPAAGTQAENTPQPSNEEVAGSKDASPEEPGETPRRKGASTLQQMKEQANEGDEAPAGSLTLRQILGGDYLLPAVRNHVWLIMLIVLLTIVYVGFRYQCQQDIIEIDRLEKELTDAKYRAMSSSSTLTELCRQSNVLRVLRENQDTLLKFSDQPPYIITIEN